MKFRLLILIVILFSVVKLNAQRSFSTKAEYSLITCEPGKDIYSLFGHTAIRIKDTIRGKDLVFNYGIFDFSSDKFIWKFVKGETYYMLGIQDFDSFMNAYKFEGRDVWEQILHITIVLQKYATILRIT